MKTYVYSVTITAENEDDARFHIAQGEKDDCGWGCWENTQLDVVLEDGEVIWEAS